MEDTTNTPRIGGWTDVARALSTPAQTVSRQQVYVWWSRRTVNDFPSCLTCVTPTDTAHTTEHQGKHVFSLAEVAEWYAAYRPSVGGRPRKMAA